MCVYTQLYAHYGQLHLILWLVFGIIRAEWMYALCVLMYVHRHTEMQKYVFIYVCAYACGHTRIRIHIDLCLYTYIRTNIFYSF